MRLLYRFYDPWDGRITVGGEDIKNITLDSLRRSIGVVPQDSVLFHNTILYNVSYGNLSVSDEEVMNAIEIAGLKRAIEGKPLRYETPVGERGLKLSGMETILNIIGILLCMRIDKLFYRGQSKYQNNSLSHSLLSLSCRR